MKTIEELRDIMDVPVIDNAYKATEKYIKENFPEFHNHVISSHPEVVGEKVWSRKLYLCFNNLESEPVCKECGKLVRIFSFFKGYNGFCSYKCVSKNIETIKKKEKTCLENYGVKHPSQSIEIQNKKEETCFKNYGVKHPLQNKEIQKRKEETCLKHYGVENPSQSIKIKKKKEETCIKNYGVENPSQSSIVKNRKKQTYFKNYGVEWHCTLIKNEYKISKFETKYLDYIEELIKPLGCTLIRNSKTIILGWELDGYIPNLSLAFEFNGSYWHSTKNKKTKKWQHRYKFKECTKKGINLLQVWDDWPDDVIKELLKDFVFGNDLNKYKQILYPELNDSEWPCDLGSLESHFDINNIQEHKTFHNKFECYDSGLITIIP